MPNYTEHNHNPVQHRDARPPWCNTCGLTADFKTPKSRLDKKLDVVAEIHPTRLSTDDLAKKWFDEDEREAEEHIGMLYKPLDWETAHIDLKQKYIRRVQEARR